MSDPARGAAGEGPAARGLSRWGLPLFAAAVGALLVFDGLRLPLTQQYAGIGPGFLVLFVGLALMAIGGCLAWQVAQGAEFEAEQAEGADLSSPVSLERLGLAAAGVGLPVVLAGWLGFPLAAGFAYACITRAYGSRSLPLDIVIGLVLASVVWFAFTKLGVQLGPFLSFGAG